MVCFWALKMWGGTEEKKKCADLEDVDSIRMLF
jgi:hypothetical protein